MKLDDEIELHWRMVFKDNEGGVGDEKVIIHAKRWYFYMNKKKS